MWASVCGGACECQVGAGRVRSSLLHIRRRTGRLSEARRNLDESKEDLAIFRNFERINEQFSKLEGWWENHIDKFQCEIPDEDVERQINTWTPIQTVHNARYSRSISWHAPGFRGFGYRDTATDMIGIAYRDPSWARQMCLYLFSQQFEDGHAVHACYPEEGGGDYHGSHSKSMLMIIYGCRWWYMRFWQKLER